MNKALIASIVVVSGIGGAWVVLHVQRLNAQLAALQASRDELEGCARQLRDLRARLESRQGRSRAEGGDLLAHALSEWRTGFGPRPERAERRAPDGLEADEVERRGPDEAGLEPDELAEGPGEEPPGQEHEEAERRWAEQRRAAAREALIEGAELEAAQVEQLDAAVARMNDQLVGIAEDFRARVGGREPTQRESMALAADALGVLLESGDELRAMLSEEQAAAASDEGLDPLSYVDPALHDVMREMDDYQEAREHHGEEGEPD